MPYKDEAKVAVVMSRSSRGVLGATRRVLGLVGNIAGDSWRYDGDCDARPRGASAVQ